MDCDIKRMLVQAYDRYAAARDGSVFPDWKRAEREGFTQLVKAEGKTTLLEIGAGPGRDCRFYQDNGLGVVATDISPEMIRLCRAKGVPGILMDCYRLGFKGDSFDAVWALNSLLHVPRRRLPGVLAEIRAVLRPRGLLYLGQWGGNGFEGILEDDHYTPKRFFSFQSDEEITGAVGRLFEPVSFKGIRPGGGRAHFQSMIWRNPGEE